ncbi:MAG: hypothetical protein ACLP7F_24570 [Acidimicrobiales bacterium]
MTAAPARDQDRGQHFLPVPHRRLDATWARIKGWPALGLMSAVVTLLSWRSLPWRVVTAGLSSWQAGLALGFEQHRQWGPQVVFTFGPYGFVEDVLPFFRATAALGLLYALVVTAGLAVLVISALRASWGLLAASAAAWASVTIAANLLEAPELALATALGLALAGLGAGPEKARRGLLTALGALAGFQVLVEVNVGLVTTVLAVLAVAGSTDRWRPGAVRAGAAFLIVTVVALVAAGQSLGNFVSYLHGAFAVAVGYGSAMGLSAGRRAEDWYALIDAALLVLIFVLALRGSPLRRQVAVTLMLALWGWETLKEGFVRHDLHDLTFFGLFLVALALARLPRRYVPAQAVSIALASLLACLANGGVPPSLRSPVEDVKAFYAEVADLSSAARWSRVQAIARYQVRATGDALHPGMVASLAGLTLAAEPWDDAVTFGYPQLRWRPEPVLQSYSAYTPYLDGLDASLLASPGAPQRILYQHVALDDRDPFWDPPSAMVAMYCHYRQLYVSGPWQVLGRAPDRCGPEQVVGRARARFGQPIDVPLEPGDLVLASFSLSSPILARAEGLFLKPPPVRVTTWAAGQVAGTAYRFVPGTAGDDHVLRAPASLGYSPAFTPPPVQRLEVTGGGWQQGQGQVSVTFLAVPMGR